MLSNWNQNMEYKYNILEWIEDSKNAWKMVLPQNINDSYPSYSQELKKGYHHYKQIQPNVKVPILLTRNDLSKASNE